MSKPKTVIITKPPNPHKVPNPPNPIIKILLPIIFF